MSNLSAVLFPHARLSSREQGRILSFFDSLSVCVPWHLDLAEAAAEGTARIVRPPEALDPGEPFLKALHEYLDWVRLHGDRSGLSFLKTGAGMGEQEDPLWEIRRRIREGGAPDSPSGTGDAFRWHLILHLADEWERQRSEADRILNALRDKRSPLNGLTDDSNDIRNLFEDLPGFDWAPEAAQSNPSPTLEAWLGLFEKRLDPKDLLVTLDHRYIEHLIGLWADSAGEPGMEPPLIRFSYPDLSGHSLSRLAEIRRDHFPEEASRELGRLLSELGEAPFAEDRERSSRAEALAAFCPDDLAFGRVLLTAVHLPAASLKRGTEGEAALLRDLTGRTVISLNSLP